MEATFPYPPTKTKDMSERSDAGKQWKVRTWRATVGFMRSKAWGAGSLGGADGDRVAGGAGGLGEGGFGMIPGGNYSGCFRNFMH